MSLTIANNAPQGKRPLWQIDIVPIQSRGQSTKSDGTLSILARFDHVVHNHARCFLDSIGPTDCAEPSAMRGRESFCYFGTRYLNFELSPPENADAMWDTPTIVQTLETKSWNFKYVIIRTTTNELFMYVFGS